jgi:hypothetical protein
MTHTPRASAIVRTFEGVWAAIRKANPDVPEAVVILASGSLGRKLNLGHHAPMRWTPAGGGARLSEVMVAGESLGMGAEEILNTLLHEAAHAVAFARGIKDCSREGNRYHNREFAKLAAEVGLEAPEKPCTKIGFSACTLPAETVAKYTRQLAAIRNASTITRVREGGGAVGGGGQTPEGGQGEDTEVKHPGRNGVVLVCAGCARKLRQRGKTDRATVCAKPDGEICGIMKPEGKAEGTEDE